MVKPIIQSGQHPMNTYPLVLASASPRRKDILHSLGFEVINIPSNITETKNINETAQDYVLRMAIEKNQAANIPDKLKHYPLISADTIVCLNKHILGKPNSTQEAYNMLKKLSGQTHQVLTAVCIRHQQQQYHVIQHNHVKFKTLSHAEIQAYIATGEPMDKAGAYGIQGIGSIFIQHLSGSFSGVMGLPIFETMQLLQQCGLATPPFQTNTELTN